MLGTDSEVGERAESIWVVYVGIGGGGVQCRFKAISNSGAKFDGVYQNPWHICSKLDCSTTKWVQMPKEKWWET